MDTHEPPSWIWAPFIPALWPGVKHDTRRCETGTPSLLPTVTLSLRQEEQQLTTCKASGDKPEAPTAGGHSLQACSPSPEELGEPLPGDSKEGSGASHTEHRKQVDRTVLVSGPEAPVARPVPAPMAAVRPDTSGPNSSLSCCPGARPKGRDGEDAVPAPEAVSMGKSVRSVGSASSGSAGSQGCWDWPWAWARAQGTCDGRSSCSGPSPACGAAPA